MGIYPEFDDFWMLYDKKCGKQLAILEWAKLTQKEKEQAVDYIPAYIQANPEKRYRLDPCRYLKRKKFEDEIITNNGKQQPTVNDQRKENVLSSIASRYTKP